MDQAVRVVRGWFGDGLVRNTAIYWTASVVVSFVNYLYYPVLGRLMQPADFGEVQTIISIFTQVAVFLQVLSLVGISIITKYSSETKRRQVTDELSRLALMLSLVVFALTILCTPLLVAFFHFSSALPFLVMAAAILISVPLSFANSYLQGHKRFWTLSAGNLMGSVVKLVGAVLFVSLGLRTFGAVGALVCAQLVALTYALWMGTGLRRFVSTNLKPRMPDIGLIRPEIAFAGIVLVTSITTNLMLSFDILVVKHYFSPVQAGLYTGISIVSNIIYFVMAPMAATMIPNISPSKGTVENQKFLRKSLLISLMVGGGVTLVFLLVPHLVVGILLGTKFSAYAGYLRGLSLALLMMSVVNLLVYYHIGLRNYLVAPVVGAGLVSTLWLLMRLHATMGAVVNDLVIGSLVTLVLLGSMTIWYRREAMA